jgi:hypothetical protein
MIDHLTTWILKAFLAIAPIPTGCRMGAAFFECRIGPIQPPQLTKFSPTSENFFSFLPRPTTFDLRPTALPGAGAKTQAFVRAAQGSARAGIGFVRAAPGSARVSPVSVRIAQGFVPILKNGGKVARWQGVREKRKSDPQISQITQIFSFRILKPNA